PVESLAVTVNIAAAAPIRTVYSPTHQADIARPDSTHAICKLRLRDVARPDDLRLLYGTEAAAVGLNVLSYKPEGGEDGYFLLLATPEQSTARTAHVGKTMVFLCDRSGSMSGEKIRQAKSALDFLVRQLEPGDTFNIVAYDSDVDAFRPELQGVTPETIRAAQSWVEGISAGGGTNIDGALRTGLRMVDDPARPNYLILLTDGQPTAGETQEARIVANAAQENHAQARVFAFGIGFDVNARLLEGIARETRGQSAYVRPNESIEAPVSALYAKIGSPMMTGVAVDVELDGGAISRVYPRRMPDLFRGDQLVLAGRYRAGGAARIRLTGMTSGKRREFTYHADFAASSPAETNAFVARVWATRRIGEIIDELDLHGRNQELVDELVSLSQRYGILTPYTSFLADEDVNLSARRQNITVAAESVAMQLRDVSGASGVNQRSFKGQLQAAAAPMALPPPPPQATNAMQQIGQKTFFRKGGVWQDSTVTAEQARTAIHVVQFSKEYFELAASHGGVMAQYLAVNEPLLVVLGGQAYQIDPAR
ncbi:MAG: VWA domain-containing protein, partial [Acidobacteria bacterium]|nr:VWA domain-containing protein [Acidobacteriota bacterium]